MLLPLLAGPYGSSSLFSISADVVLSIGLLSCFTDLSLLYMYSIVIIYVSIVVSTCSLCIGFELLRWYLPHFAICGTLSVLHVTFMFCSLFFGSSPRPMPSTRTRSTFHFAHTFVQSGSTFLAIIIIKTYLVILIILL